MAALHKPALAASERERILRFIPQVDLVSLDPHFSMTNITRNHAGLVFDQLFGTDQNQQAQPQMVDGYVMEDGGKRWTLTLREGLRFHDGQTVLARDCIASVRRWGRRDVLGAELLRISDEITAPDDRTIEFRFRQSMRQSGRRIRAPKPKSEKFVDIARVSAVAWGHIVHPEYPGMQHPPNRLGYARARPPPKKSR